jgi:AcrR family transcriptional regulator
MSTAPRRRNSAATKQALLDAAGLLFDERGFDRATLRDIADSAGVDPALVARYFGSKEQLYLAVLSEAERAPAPVTAPLEALERMFTPWDQQGRSPMAGALAGPRNPGLQPHVRAFLEANLLEPVAATLDERGVEDARLRTELLVAVIAGVVLARSNGTLPKLAAAEHDDVLKLLRPLVRALGRPPRR